MFTTSHDLGSDFPEHATKMQYLRRTDAQFSMLFAAYHQANRATRRAATHLEPATETHLMELRRESMRLKDEIYDYLTAA